MITILKLIVLTSIWILGLRIVTNDGMVLHSIRRYAETKIKKEGKIIYEPLIYCVWCMPSIHTMVGFAIAFSLGILHDLSWNLLIMYSVVAMASSLICGLIWQLYLLMDAAEKYYVKSEQLAHLEVGERIRIYKSKKFRNEKKQFQSSGIKA